jgi:hypothetical protein
LRKYTGPNQVCPGRALRNAGSCDQSRCVPISDIFSRDSEICSRPRGSICATSVTASAWRRSFRNSMRRCSRPSMPSCGSAAYFSCCSIWNRNSSTRAAAATAFSRCRTASARWFSS